MYVRRLEIHTFGKEVNLDMFKEKFGIEIEFTGITRNKASKVVAEIINGSISEARDYYDTKEIKALDGVPLDAKPRGTAKP